ncbi:PAQR family membrane homeostasis protein TrhA [Phosphitispora fastidiosa]|uniref:PAQR family membrane homeostasis protein TrhA n=1 Tax=Phosphitispora fastidiosa TaxID=2837202 RepID=UPI001E5E6300|nr:hemolysin III family protein [Phosphitispora fastidiosa]MBU7008256.1 hemolysin III [Phosphitispora fastidiosa]
MVNTGEYSLAEERINALTHGIGTALAVTGLVLLIVFAVMYGDIWHIVSFSIYGSTLVLMYLISTLYHALRNRKAKDILKVLDHSAIYLLIAGTYTPFTLITLHGRLGWILFGVVWGLAIAGIVFKIFFVKRFRILSTALYLAMGWLVVSVVKPLVAGIPGPGLAWLVAGGVLYSSGTFFYIRKKKAFNHAVWHLFVMAGSVCHFLAVLLYVLPLKS